MSDGGGQYLQPCGATRFTTTVDLVDATFGEDRPLSAECSSQTLRYDSRCVSSSHSNAIVIVHGKLCMLRVCKRLQIIFDFL